MITVPVTRTAHPIEQFLRRLILAIGFKATGTKRWPERMSNWKIIRSIPKGHRIEFLKDSIPGP